MASRKARAGGSPAPVPPVAADQSAAANAGAGGASALEVVPSELPEGSGRFPVLSPLRFDGQLYGPADPEANEVVMPRDQAEALQPIGVLGEELT